MDVFSRQKEYVPPQKGRVQTETVDEQLEAKGLY